MSPRARLSLLALVLTAFAGAPAVRAAPVAGVQYREWSFSDGNDLHDPIVYVATRAFHVQLEEWLFDRGQDQFRPELGLHLHDRRRSAYTLTWRGERRDDRFWAGTEQVVSDHWVARGDVSPIVFRDGSPTLTVWDAGADYYWGSYAFAGATVIRDPRAADLWIVPLRVRLANEANDWLQLTVAPASRRTLGWAADVKWRILRAGIERNSRFDFTNLDNVIGTLGIEVPIAPPPR